MPELPEVETVARQLDPVMRGRQIARLQLLDPLLGDLKPKALRDATVLRVYRLGKQVVVETTRRGWTSYLLVHLRMTGRLLALPARRPCPTRHLRARIHLRGGGSVLFVDPRRFGTLEIVAELASAQPKGVDPTSAGFTRACLGRLIAESGGRQPLKPWLLRQDRLVGLGNIYAAEIPFHARIHPAREIGTLEASEIGRLHQAVKKVLDAAIAHCGTTFSDFQTVRGSIGSYQQYLAVYGREGQLCGRCQTPIEKVAQQQRSTFFCPKCQPAA